MQLLTASDSSRTSAGRIMSVWLIMMAMLVAQISITLTEAELNSVLNIKRDFPYLIAEHKPEQVIQPRDYMDFENLYSPNDTYKAQQTIQGRNYYMLKAFDFANYFQSDYWHYSNQDDLINSAWPVADQQKCAQQLDWLEEQIMNSSKLFQAGEQHLQLATLVDSFGRPEANTYLGHGYWLGSYYECNKVTIDMDKFRLEECDDRNCANRNSSTTKSPMKTRYCIGKAREIDWPNDNYVPRVSYKVGLCLPETCQTTSISGHRQQLEKLMRFNMPDYLRSRIILDDMYCLPDERSPIRSLSLSAKIYLALVLTWLIALLFATLLYSCLRRQQKDLRHLASQMQTADLVASQDKAIAMEDRPAEGLQSSEQPLATDGSSSEGSVIRLPADPEQRKGYLWNYIVHQVDKLRLNESAPKSVPSSPSLVVIRGKQMDTSKEVEDAVGSSEMPAPNSNQQHKHHDDRSETSYNSSTSSLSAWLTESPLIVRLLRALSIRENMREFQEPPRLLKGPDAKLRLRINLNALDAIKCLCCILVIFGHIVFIHMQHLTNIVHTIELSYEVAPRILMAFFNFVDTFFIISGMLTAYFIFKRFNKRSFANPLIWLYISLLRLVRLSPVYLLVFWFAKTITVHLADGPIWDYATDSSSIKGLCQNDHWWKSLLYLGNVGTMQPLCILPAWSIIIDAQYSLIVPPMLFLIFRHKRLGYLALLIAVIISTANMSYQLATQTAVKTSDMAKVRLHVYPLISRFAAEFYNTAWNRLGPIAVGILGGHMLYLYDVGHIRRWPYFMRGAYFKFVLILHMLIFVLPAIGRFTDNPELATPVSSTAQPDLALFVLSNATIKPIWSIINTIFLLRLITDLRTSSVLARLMSHNSWHCLGKLCFSCYLIHYEIILILLKSRQDGLMDPNWWNVAREFSLALLISTAIAYLIYILVEAPINKLVLLNVDKSNLVKNQSSAPHQNRVDEEQDRSDENVDPMRNFQCHISDTPKKINSSASCNHARYQYESLQTR